MLIGAGIGLVSGLLGAVVQHLLSLRADMKKRELDRQDREAERRRVSLLAGTDEVLAKSTRGIVIGDIDGGISVSKIAGRDIRRVEKEEGQGEESDESSE